MKTTGTQQPTLEAFAEGRLEGPSPTRLAHRRSHPRVVDGGATVKAIDYSLMRWTLLLCYLNDTALPINNYDEHQIRTWVLGRANWLFARSLHAGQRAAAITSLIQSAKLNGHDPYAYLKDVLIRQLTH